MKLIISSYECCVKVANSDSPTPSHSPTDLTADYPAAMEPDPQGRMKRAAQVRQAAGHDGIVERTSFRPVLIPTGVLVIRRRSCAVKIAERLPIMIIGSQTVLRDFARSLCSGDDGLSLTSQ